MFQRAMMLGALAALAVLAGDVTAAEKAQGKPAVKAAKARPPIVKVPPFQKTDDPPAKAVAAPPFQKFQQPPMVKPPAAPKAKPKIAREKKTPNAALPETGQFDFGLLSGNAPELLSGNRADFLSGNDPALLSGNRASVLSGNSARLVSKLNVLSGIKIQVNITITGNNNRGDSPDEAFGRFDRDGDGRLSPAEFRESLEATRGPASF